MYLASMPETSVEKDRYFQSRHRKVASEATEAGNGIMNPITHTPSI